MTEKTARNGICPYDRANILSKITFWWLNSLFKKGFKTGLSLADVSACPEKAESSLLLKRIEKTWQKHLDRFKAGGKANLFIAVLSTFGYEFIFPGLMMFFCEVCKMTQPFIIGQLILYFQKSDQVNKRDAYIYAISLGLIIILAMLSDLFHFYKQQFISMKMKTAVGALIYKKLLSLSSQTFHLTNSGKIVNLLSTDLEKFNWSFETIHFLWICPIQLVAIISLLYHYVGYPSLFAVVVIAVLLPIQIFCGRMFGKLRTKIGKWSDQRINKMNEILSGIKVIKMYCWEKPFHNVVTSLRKREIKFVKLSMTLKALNLALMKASPKLMSLVIFLTIWYIGQPLNERVVFVTVGWMFILQDSVFLFLFISVENITTLLASLKRIQDFLLLDESKTTRTFKDVECKPVTKDTRVSIDIFRMTARWHVNENDHRYSKMEETERLLMDTEMDKYFSLSNINLSVYKGELLAVVGEVGAGKSSLLMTIMGEIHHNKGKITVHGSLSYACQHSWVFSGSVRDNVLMDDVFDKERYQKVLQTCALLADIGRLSQGDATLVGERGLLLSGGQKSRLTLARAVYRDCDIYLLDDPLSSVDSEVGQHIFHHCINGLLKDKTRILVTHQLQYLQSADRILVLKGGKISNIGTYNELVEQGIDLAGLANHNQENENPPIKELEAVETLQWKEDTVEMNEETKSKGGIKFWVYKEYVKAGYGYILVPILLLVLSVYSPSYFLADWNLARWVSEDNKARTSEQNQTDIILSNISSTSSSSYLVNNSLPVDINSPQREVTYHMKLYLIFFSSFVLFCFFSFLLLLHIFIYSSRNLHNRMFQCVLSATMRLFDSQPLGRILNRFSRDIGLMDDMLIRIVNINLELFLSLVGVCINICIIAPWLFIALVPLSVIVIAIRYYAVRTTRDVKRLEALAKSPVYCHVSDTIIGLQTIRVSGKQEQFSGEFDEFQNAASGAWFTYLSAYRWFSIRSLLCMIIFIIVSIQVCLAMKDAVPSALLALALTYLISFGMPFEFFVRMTAELENSMTSVERVLSYTHVKEEAARTSDRPPPKDWPSQGSITFSDVQLRYTPDSPVILKNINLHIRSKEKIGIVGRTGAGKSSLLTALFRMAEPEGQIWIDGWNVLQIGLDELRSKISVIPQDPVLFSGTLRYNLDPFDEYSDERLWNALQQVQLRDKVAEMPDNLYMEMSESGHNFSVGQRQLVCLARAILRYNTILVLDEATAHVDHNTDELIQGTIRSKFRDSTVLTIAHRLHTIMDCDRVMVLHDGEVKEFDTPFNLLQEENGFFTNLVEQTGPEQAAFLTNMARLANQNRASASMLLEKAVQKATKQLSTSRTSLDKSIRSRNSIHRKESDKKSKQDATKENSEKETDNNTDILKSKKAENDLDQSKNTDVDCSSNKQNLNQNFDPSSSSKSETSNQNEIMV